MMKSVYSPRQIQAATFLGGPFTAAYLLKKAYLSFDKPTIATWASMAYLLLGILMVPILPLLPEKLPNNVVPILYLIPVIVLLQKTYWSKQQIEESDVLAFESNWKVAGVTVAGLVAFVTLFLGYVFWQDNGDTLAERLVQQINQTEGLVNPELFSGMQATKDPAGSGVVLTVAVKPDFIEMFRQAEQVALRENVIAFMGKEFLRDIHAKDVYVIFKFADPQGQLVNQVILSPSNLDAKG